MTESQQPHRAGDRELAGPQAVDGSSPHAMDPLAGVCPDAWRAVLQTLAERCTARGIHPARALLLVPFAQLMPVAARAWMGWCPNGFMPRIETTRNWARQLHRFEPAALDFSGDAARDWLTARSLLEQAGLGPWREALAPRLLEAVAQLAVVAAAQAPLGRTDWGRQVAAQLPLAGEGDGPLVFEAALARLGLAWASTSAYPTDVLFEARALEAVDAVFLVEGLSPDPLATALAQHWGERVERLALAIDVPRGTVRLHESADAEDEAERAAACVIGHIHAGRVPVALVANDRALTRRVRALLAQRGVRIRDENGWKLSTTRMAANLMALLRALAPQASCDEVLDAVKNQPAWATQRAANALEAWLRRNGVREWRKAERSHAAGVFEAPPEVAALMQAIAQARTQMSGAKTLPAWLQALDAVLRDSGAHEVLLADVAGQRVLEVLRLGAGEGAALGEMPAARERMRLGEFAQWVDAVLESESLVPVHPVREQVTILPLPQMLGRSFAAAVLPGCDEDRLPAAPEPRGFWTAAQRRVLGLPEREALAQSQREAFELALRTLVCDILWRKGDEGDRALLPSSLVQALQLDRAGASARDPRERLPLEARPVTPPAPDGAPLPVRELSASAYADLRACPYRFFVLRQLQLSEAGELDVEIDKRDFGSWLHLVLRHFHEALQADPTDDAAARAARMDEAAARATREQGIDEADFLPFAASWPTLRDGYLAWLRDYEAAGARFERAESDARTSIGPYELVGRLDRVDRSADGVPLVIDYKTESDERTAGRIKDGNEDVQLAFYAALLPEDTVQAAYLNVSEREGCHLYAPDDVTALRDHLLEGVAHDLARIADGAPLRALGEGSACTYCAARGLCRKDFWALPAHAPVTEREA
ncbi:MAG: hypothetical protein Fur0019_09780 [Tibeticola sp.]